MEVVTDPRDVAQARAQRERRVRNSTWLKAHAAEVYPPNRGKFICIAGEELFAADTPAEAWDLGGAAHPEDDGAFVLYVPRESIPRIYDILKRPQDLLEPRPFAFPNKGGD